MIHFTEHAKERMAQRNIREEIITENLEMFYVTANFLPPRIFNSKLLQYPKAKVI